MNIFYNKDIEIFVGIEYGPSPKIIEEGDCIKHTNNTITFNGKQYPVFLQNYGLNVANPRATTFIVFSMEDNYIDLRNAATQQIKANLKKFKKN